AASSPNASRSRCSARRSHSASAYSTVRTSTLQALATGALERRREILRERRLKVERLAGERVFEREPGRVEELPLQTEITRHAVDGITGHGQVDRAEMDADLMRSAGLEANTNERMLGQQLD